MLRSTLLTIGFASLVYSLPGSPSRPHEPRAAVITASSSSIPAYASAGNDPCARVSRLSREFAENNPPSATPTVPAEIAYECIRSVHFDRDAAVELMDSIRPYINWQTTLQYVKDPPAEYAEKVQPPYDFWAEFNRIYEKAKAGAYTAEYDFGFDLYLCVANVHDGHFAYWPDSATLIFTFGRTIPLVSVSGDGESVPEIYAYSDILATTSGDTTFTPSPLKKINDQDSTEYLLDFAQYGSSTDPDALWNQLFYVPAQVQLGPYGTGTGTFTGNGRARFIYPGPTTTLTFSNGTSVTTENFARVLESFHGIQNGADIRRTYLIPPKSASEPAESLATAMSSSSSAAAVPAPITTTMPAPGYPSPFIREPNNLNAGYFLQEEEYDDIAVLAVSNFVDLSEDELPFQKINTYFINEAVAKGKKKLIVDLSANNGGTILQGYDLFKQLFPQIRPYGGQRFRAHEAFYLAGKEISYYSGLVPRTLALNETALNEVGSPLNYRTDVDRYYNNFYSWDEKYGPHTYGPMPDNYTSIVRWNLSDVLTPYEGGGIYVSGYLRRSNITQQPFAAENIVLVYDGYCASTCSIFSELMRQQGGIKTIALGGRPNKDIIQPDGGTKGTNDVYFENLLHAVKQPFKIHHYHSPTYYEQETVLGDYNDLPTYRSTAAVVNFRDGLREGDITQTPLQFRYEPADCRIYYTPEMVVDQEVVWKSVADIDECVVGSYPNVKRDVKRRSKHQIRKDINFEKHYTAMAEVWTGKDGLSLDGDAMVIP